MAERLLTHFRLTGPRFQDGGADLDVFQELASYKRLVFEIAKELWRERNPTRVRLPKGFEDSVSLKVYSIESGSVALPIMRTTVEGALFESTDTFDAAADLLEETVRSASGGELLPSEFPRGVLPFFSDFGRTLTKNDAIVLQSPRRANPARYTDHTRETLETWSERTYTDVAEVIGEVRAADLDGSRLVIRSDDGEKISAKFAPEQEADILEALRGHASCRVFLRGLAEFDFSARALRQILAVDHVEIVRADLAGVLTEPRPAAPFWETLADIGKGVADADWKAVPSDMARNYKKYLYGDDSGE